MYLTIFLCIPDIPLDLLDEWCSPAKNDEFFLPNVNHFIPDHFEIFIEDVNVSTYPVKILESSWGALWYKIDKTFKLPRAYCNIIFVFPDVLKSPRQ